MIESQLMCPVLLAAILACPFVAQKNVKSREGRPRFGLYVFLESNDARHPHLEARGMDHGVIFRHDIDAIEEYSFDGFLP